MSLENHGDPWSDEDEEKLRNLYPDTAATQLVEEFGRTHEALKAKAKTLGIRKGDDWAGRGTAVSDEAGNRGVEAEQRFEEFVEGKGWEWYRNSAFRNSKSQSTEWETYQNQKEYLEALITDPGEDWVSEAKEEEFRDQLEEMRKEIEEKSDWFYELREQVFEALDESERYSTLYPDYVVGDRPDGPIFVEVKYGSSNLMQGQIDFFGLLRDRGFDVYIFRVKPTGDMAFSEWDGGWK
jgi:hypothetical protein